MVLVGVQVVYDGKQLGLYVVVVLLVVEFLLGVFQGVLYQVVSIVVFVCQCVGVLLQVWQVGEYGLFVGLMFLLLVLQFGGVFEYGGLEGLKNDQGLMMCQMFLKLLLVWLFGFLLVLYRYSGLFWQVSWVLLLLCVMVEYGVVGLFIGVIGGYSLVQGLLQMFLLLLVVFLLKVQMVMLLVLIRMLFMVLMLVFWVEVVKEIEVQVSVSREVVSSFMVFFFCGWVV